MSAPRLVFARFRAAFSGNEVQVNPYHVTTGNRGTFIVAGADEGIEVSGDINIVLVELYDAADLIETEVDG